MNSSSIVSPLRPTRVATISASAAAVDLLAGRERERRRRTGRFRQLVGGEPVAGEAAELVERGRGRRVARHDHRDADLAHHTIRRAERPRPRRRPGASESTASTSTGYTLYPPRTYISLRAADEAEPAAVVDPAEVAGAHEAVRRERGPRRLGIAPVAAHDGGGPQAHHADLARRHRAVVLVEQPELDGGVRASDAHDRVLLGVVERGAEPDAGFGARVAGHERGAEAASRLLGEARASPGRRPR